MDPSALLPELSRRADEAPIPRSCTTCGRLGARLKRGRCDACYAYWRKYARERPSHLWGRSFTGRASS
jgi:hypothetical protein